MAKSDDLIKYTTVQVVRYLNTPKDERKKAKAEPKAREPWSTKWFGMIPAAIMMMIRPKRVDLTSTNGVNREVSER
ncbi:YqzE family protein [Paenibacillus sp. N1-5-1-14]|uniref:YqzE family protein n=1 Tax=Paenibacillus radicibacter TaxID=2972488 RepID=UPI002158ADDA|nr:YqzE family protein [Paenibacillus radicibacter]MCR8643935.1 YqzE family protein [Paenibacillus radicibacter]